MIDEDNRRSRISIYVLRQERKKTMSNTKKISTGKYALLGFQHVFAMFGATVLVPTLTGLDVATCSQAWARSCFTW